MITIRHNGETKTFTDEEFVRESRKAGATDEEIAQVYREQKGQEAFDKFLLSGLLGAALGSGIVGGLLGGNLLGGIIGDGLFGDDDPFF